MRYSIVTIVLLTVSLLLIILLLIFLLYRNNNRHGEKRVEDYEKKQYIKTYRALFSELFQKLPLPPKEGWETETTIIIKTLNRPKCLLRLLTSIRKFFPSVHIVVVDDSLYKIFERSVTGFGITYIPIPINAGVSLGRNIAVNHVKTKYSLAVDDDFMFTPKSSIRFLYCFLNHHHDYDIICAGLDDRGLYSGKFIYKPEKKTLDIIQDEKNPKNGADISLEEIEPNIFRSHRGLNFFMARTQLLKTIPWDPILQTQEHTEHFFRMYLKGVRIAVHRTVEANHDGGKNCDGGDILNYRVKRNRRFDDYFCLKHDLLRVGNYKIPRKQLDFMTVLNDLDSVLKQGKINYHLAMGTALGLHRNGSFIPYDPDIDVMVFGVLWSNVQQLFKSSKTFSFIIKRGEQNNGCEATYQHNPTKTRVDIFWLYNTSPETQESFDFLWYSTYAGKNYSEQKRWKLPTYTPESLVLCKKKFYIMPKWILDYTYGGDWHTPKNYTYDESLERDEVRILWRYNEKYNNDSPVPVPSDNFLNEYFGKYNIWVINLDRRPERLQEAKKHLGSIGVTNFTRLRAVDGKDIGSHPYPITSGEIGCLLSHRAIWQQIVANRVPWTLIFEDDLVIADDVSQKTFGDVMKEATYGKRNPQIVYFGYCPSNSRDIPSIFNSAEVSIKMGKAFCTHAYCITWRGARHMLKITENNYEKALDVITEGECGKDNDMCAIVYYKKKYGKGSSKTRVLSEGIVLQKAADSDVKFRGKKDMKER